MVLFSVFLLHELREFGAVLVEVEGPVPQLLRIGLSEEVFAIDLSKQCATLTRSIPFAKIYTATRHSLYVNAEVVVTREKRGQCRVSDVAYSGWRKSTPITQSLFQNPTHGHCSFSSLWTAA